MYLDDISQEGSRNIWHICLVFILLRSIIVAHFHRSRFTAEYPIRLMYIFRCQCINLVRKGIAEGSGLSSSGLTYHLPIGKHNSSYKVANQVSLEEALCLSCEHQMTHTVEESALVVCPSTCEVFVSTTYVWHLLIEATNLPLLKHLLFASHSVHYRT